MSLVGTKVRHSFYGEGTVIAVELVYVLVQYTKSSLGLHNGNGRGKDGRCWWVRLEVINDMITSCLSKEEQVLAKIKELNTRFKDKTTRKISYVKQIPLP